MKNGKPQICVIESANGGGLIHFAYQLCAAFANEGLDVTLIVGTEYELADLPHNFTVKKMLRLWKSFEPHPLQASMSTPWKRALGKIAVTLRRMNRGMRMLSGWISLTAYLTRARPDLIQFSRIEYFFEFFFIAYLRSRGLVLSQICHEFEPRENNNWFSRLLLKLDTIAYNQFSAIFFLAQEIRQRFLTLFPMVPESNTHVIPHGNSGWLLHSNPPRELPDRLRAKYAMRNGEAMVLFFGLLAPSKGLDDLLEAFALVRQACPAKLVVAGYPTKHVNMDQLKEKAATLGLGDSVFFDERYIPYEEIGAIMELASVVVYPYRSGTQSGALQVAYTFGRPVIATEVGGLPEVVEEGKSGFLVPVQSPRDLADRIMILVNDPKRAAEMGEYARHLSNTKFSWQTVARQMNQVYEELLKTPQ